MTSAAASRRLVREMIGKYVVVLANARPRKGDVWSLHRQGTREPPPQNRMRLRKCEWRSELWSFFAVTSAWEQHSGPSLALNERSMNAASFARVGQVYLPGCCSLATCRADPSSFWRRWCLEHEYWIARGSESRVQWRSVLMLIRDRMRTALAGRELKQRVQHYNR